MADFTAITFRRFVDQEQNVPWLVEKLLPATGSTLLVGQAGVGKTTLALQLSAAIHDGVEIFGRGTMKSRALYMQFDSPTIEWRAICKRVVPKSTGYTVIDAPRHCFDNKEYLARLDDLINDKVKPGFIVWDSLYKLTQKDVKSDGIMPVLYALDMVCQDAPYMVLHHPPRGELRASGHNGISGHVSSEWHLMKNKLRIDKGRLVEEKELRIIRESKHPGLWVLRGDDIDLDDLERAIRGI